ncbi:Flagellar hook-basal body complex protein FliE [Tepidimonas alkaliphilus]|uniref:Flagellar hook-basal body complex protein FliE n=1 Tax=Tepidimonas alkaliphilus TaxID=2588942 RepID=A0A554W4U2_9BURK|nr:flagellar hook-basal body complex protein FliE [Tepidimonas alkaliphilus]TSE18600.1 Flagellar hook-basal body complex protein FliE [Tepidimonas alkaliphilus]
MDLRLLPLASAALSPAQAAALRAAQKALAAQAAAGGAVSATGAQTAIKPQATPQPGFGEALRSALREVSAAQHRASELQNRVQMGDRSASLEETMVAMQKAQIGFQAALHVRNRMMQAYTDIMNMQV